MEDLVEIAVVSGNMPMIQILMSVRGQVALMHINVAGRY